MDKEQNVEQYVCTAWDDNALRYIAAHYSVIPLAPKQKGPKLPNWSRYCNELMQPSVVISHYGKNHNIGLCLGEASGVMAVDIDTDEPRLLSAIERIIPDSPVKKKGRKGYTAFYKFEGQSSKSLKRGDDGIDILCSGRQTVLPPSVHPNGMKYEWITENTLLNTRVEDLPSITEAHIEKLALLFTPKQDKVIVPKLVPHYTEQSISEAEAVRALQYIDPDCSYDQWVSVGMAIYSEFGMNGWNLFNEWSARSTSKYQGVAATYKKYQACSDVRDITIGTLVMYAKQGGYTPPRTSFNIEDTIGTPEEQNEAWNVLNSFLSNSKSKVEEAPKKDITDVITNPPGILGLAYQSIKRLCYKFQPILCVGAAISFCGELYAHKFKSTSKACTNMYVILLGASGSGKSDAGNAVKKMFNWFPRFSKTDLGEPASDAGAHDALYSNGGHGIFYVDELGKYFESAKNPRGNQCLSAVLDFWTKVFSAADGSFTGKAYSQRLGKVERKIDKPCAGVLGLSTEGQLFKVIKREDFDNGMFNRWIICESPVAIAPDNPEFSEEEYRMPELVEFVNELNDKVVKLQIQRGIVQAGTGPVLLTVPKNDVAIALLKKYKEEIEARRNQLEETALMNGPLSRAVEMVEKLSLCAMEFIDGQPVVTEKSMSWAIAFEEYCLKATKRKLPYVVETQYQQDVMTVRRRMTIGKPYTRVQINRDIAPEFDTKKRQMIIDDLISQEVLIVSKDGTLTRQELDND